MFVHENKAIMNVVMSHRAAQHNSWLEIVTDNTTKISSSPHTVSLQQYK